MSTAIEPGYIPYGVPDIVHDDVWRAVMQAAADISMARKRQRQEDRKTRAQQTASSSTGSTPLQRLGSGRKTGRSERDPNPTSKRIRLGSMAASQAEVAPAASKPAGPPVDPKPYRCRAVAEVEVNQKAPSVALEEQRRGDTIYPIPLDWWKDNSTDFPLLSALSRRLLAIPAKQAQSERTF